MNLIEGTVGSKVCKNVKKTSTFTGTVTGKTFIINHKFDSNTKCLVYPLTCPICKIQCDCRKKVVAVLTCNDICLTISVRLYMPGF